MAAISGNTIRNLINNGVLFEKSTAVLERVTSVDGSKVMSYGVSFAGYDLRLSPCFLYPDSQYLRFSDDKSIVSLYPQRDRVISCFDPKTISQDKMKWSHFEVVPWGKIKLGPHCSILGESIEVFSMPDNIVGLCFGKSTYARCGILINATPIEPGWKGKLVVEISNISNHHIYLYPNEGIAQVMFFYLDNKGQYYGSWQDQYFVDSVKNNP